MIFYPPLSLPQPNKSLTFCKKLNSVIKESIVEYYLMILGYVALQLEEQNKTCFKELDVNSLTLERQIKFGWHAVSYSFYNIYITFPGFCLTVSVYIPLFKMLGPS